MEPGHWFLSLYNDDGDPHEVSFIAVIAEDMTHNCPNGCSGKGECLLGHCQCNPGFGGEDCSESVCPVLCSQRGELVLSAKNIKKLINNRLLFVLIVYVHIGFTIIYSGIVLFICVIVFYIYTHVHVLLCKISTVEISRNLR